MLLIHHILGDAGEERYRGRRVDRVNITSSDAGKSRLRASTEEGTDVGIELERGSYLRDGSILHDDGARIIVVERTLEKVIRINLDSTLDRAETIRQALRVGHTLGNQHVPVEVDGLDIRVPVTTSEEIVLAALEALELRGAEVAPEMAKLGRLQPLGVLGHHHAHVQ